MLGRSRHLPEDYFVSTFLSGLKEEIHNDVHMFQPRTLPEAITLAMGKENAIEAAKRGKKRKIGDQQALQAHTLFLTPKRIQFFGHLPRIGSTKTALYLLKVNSSRNGG